MRFLIILLFIFSTPAFAEPVSKKAARAYYENCKGKQDPNMSAETQKLLCACTAVRMHKTMEIEDVQEMTLQNEIGREATNKMLINVYAHCMQYPSKELYFQNCISDPVTQTLTKNPQQSCECLSDRIATYLGKSGPAVFSSVLSRNPNIIDPMAALSEDPQFQEFAQQQLNDCLGTQ